MSGLITPLEAGARGRGWTVDVGSHVITLGLQLFPEIAWDLQGLSGVSRTR